MGYNISIALCTFNGERFIEDQLKSIFNQTRKPDEIIICDDGSSDNTIEIIRNTMVSSDLNWVLKINNQNLGVSKNFEQAIGLCEGDIIFTCDQDDVWLPKKIEIIETLFFKNPDSLLVFTDAILVDAHLKKIGRNMWNTINYSIYPLRIDRGSKLNLLLKQNVVTGATMAFRSELVPKILPISDSWVHDHWIAIIAEIYGDVIAVSEALILYRQHDQNLIGADYPSFYEKTIKYINKFMNYIRNSDQVYEIQDTKIKMINGLLIKLEQNKPYSGYDIIYLKECYSFWERHKSLNSSKKISAIKLIITDLFRGKYHRFFTGFRGVIKELVFLLKSNRK